MIIQRVLKGITGINQSDADTMLASGIVCNWWRKVGLLPNAEIPLRLTERNLDWHQNNYLLPDPLESNEPFGRHSPFISTTAGTVERLAALNANVIHSAWEIALDFATDGWGQEGYIFYCYGFILSRPSVPHVGFAEELRDLTVRTTFSKFQPEGEITFKIEIPPAQIEKYEFYSLTDLESAAKNSVFPTPSLTKLNSLYQPPEDIVNLREVLL